MTTLAALLLALHYGCWARVQSLRTARRSFIVKDDRFVKDGKPISAAAASCACDEAAYACVRARNAKTQSTIGNICDCSVSLQCSGHVRPGCTQELRYAFLTLLVACIDV